jgi:hypothetical protein
MTTTEEAQPLTDEEIDRRLREPEPEPEDHRDPDAPYGRLGNGKPRKSPHRIRPSRARKPAGPGAPAATRGRKPRGPDYESIVGGFFQLATLPLMALSPLDVVAVADHGPAIAKAAALTAQERPEVATLLDKLAVAGPYSVLLGALTPLLMQVLVNHDRIPGGLGTKFGVKTKEKVQQEYAAMQNELQAHASAYTTYTGD